MVFVSGTADKTEKHVNKLGCGVKVRESGRARGIEIQFLENASTTIAAAKKYFKDPKWTTAATAVTSLLQKE